jgi:hypothetical protein
MNMDDEITKESESANTEHSTYQLENVMEIESTYGLNELTKEEWIEQLEITNNKYMKNEIVIIDGYEIEKRKIEIFMIGGRTEEEAIEFLVYLKKEVEAFNSIASSYNIEEPTLEAAENMKKLLFSLDDIIELEDSINLDEILLIGGFSSYEDYYSDPNKLVAAKSTLVRKAIIEIKVKKIQEDKSLLSIREAGDIGREELDIEIENYINDYLTKN